MSNFSRISEHFGDLPYMRDREAKIIRDLIVTHDARDVLEIGFFHGKSSAYIGAILEDLGRGHLVTIDLKGARRREPNIEKVLHELGLQHRVTPIFAHRSYTWELAKMIRQDVRPEFDFCYLDGGHTWDDTGFGMLLVDVLLRPGGLVVFDDLPWTIEAAMREIAEPPRYWRSCSPDEKATPCIKLVFDVLVPHLGYTDLRTVNGGRWGVARKPAGTNRSSTTGRGVVRRLTEALTGR